MVSEILGLLELIWPVHGSRSALESGISNLRLFSDSIKPSLLFSNIEGSLYFWRIRFSRLLEVATAVVVSV